MNEPTENLCTKITLNITIQLRTYQELYIYACEGESKSKGNF